MIGLRPYVLVLSCRGVRVPFVGTAVASLPIGFLGLSVLLYVGHSRGFAIAGLVLSALTCGTGVGIAAQGRLIDRFGLSPVLLSAAAVQAVAGAGLVVSVWVAAPTWVTVGCAGATGCGEPQVGGGLRALWAALLPSEQRDTGSAISSLLLQLSAVIGPVVLSVLLPFIGLAGTVLAAVGLFAIGAGLLASSRAARSWRPPSTALGRPRSRVLGSHGVRVLTTVSAVLGGIAGVVQVVAGATGGDASGPLLYAALATGSLAGTLWYGGRTGRRRPSARTFAIQCALAGLALAAGAVTTLVDARGHVAVVLLGICFAAVGLATGPLGVAVFAVVEQVAPDSSLVSSVTTVTAAGLAAMALGAATAGAVCDRWGPAPTLLLASGVGLVGVAVVAVGRKHLHVRQPSSAPR